MRRQLYKKRNRGFSLVELIAAVIIMGLLVGGVALGVNAQVKKAKMRAAQTQLSTFKQAINMFELECGSYPIGLGDLIQDSPQGCKSADGSYLDKKEIPEDPWNEPYNYSKPGIHNPSSYDVWSNGPDREEGTADDVTNWASETGDDEV